MVSGMMTMLALIVAIGAQNAFVLRQGLRGVHIVVVVILCAVSDAALVAAGVLGIGGLIERVPMVITVAKWGGAAFLLAYAFFAIRRVFRPQQLTAETDGRSALGPTVLTCLAVTYLNPHVYLDTVMLLGMLANQHGTSGRWLFAGGSMFGSVLWFSALGFGARRLRALFAKPRAWQVFDAAIAVIMIAMAGSLVLDPR